MTFITVLYGSRARGDADASSDEDVLSVGSSDLEDTATYTWEQMEAMRSYGSLFLHHLKLEAVTLDGDRRGIDNWSALMNDLPPYKRTLEDLQSFELVASDIVDALTLGDSSLAYEASVAARLVRHLAIVACYERGAPNFRRYGAVFQAAEDYGVLTPVLAPYENLYATLRQSSTVDITAGGVLDWVEFVRELCAAVARSYRRGCGNGNA